MKRIKTILLAALALVMLQGGAAVADHADHDYFKTASEGDVWSSGPASACWPQEWDSTLGETTSDNAKGRVAVARNEVAALDYNGPSVTMNEDCGNFDMTGKILGWTDAGGNFVLSSFCNNVGAGVNPMPTSNSFQYEDMGILEVEFGATIYAWTVACDTNDNNILDWFAVVFNDEFASQTKFSGDPNGSKPIGFASLMVHEFVHVVGWDGHLGDPCPMNGNEETMCATGWQGGYIYHYAGSGSTGQAWETLEAHESQEINSAY